MEDYLNDQNLWDEEVQYDPEAERAISNVPPDDRTHLVRFKLGSKGFTPPKKDKNGKAFFMVHLQGNVAAPGERHDNQAIFDHASSIVFGDGTSAITNFLKAVGQKPPSNCSLGERKQQVETALAGSPQCSVRGRWEWSIPTGEQTAAGKDKYAVVLKYMKNADKRPDGSFDPVKVIDGREVTAQFVVTAYLPLKAGATASVAAVATDDETPF